MKYIAISGTVGAGKTTLLHRLETALGDRCKCHVENPQDNPFINAYYAESNRWSFHSQVSFLSLYFHPADWREADREYYFFDRCLIENIQIARYRYESGDLTADEFHTLEMLADGIESLMPPIDRYIYLVCSEDLLAEHLKERGRQYESQLGRAYIHHLKQIYDEWGRQLPADKTLIYNCDNPPALD